MCGIAGILALHKDVAVESNRLEVMLGFMRQRGPDDAGSMNWPSGAIGMRRLSIIDLAGGHQPIANEDGTIHVVCNGEIYNSPELRAELLGFGHRFATKSDTETLVHGYEQWGIEGLLERLSGMFAFALFDAVKAQTFLARDRVGIKPLLYTVRDQRLWFASSMRALLATGAVPLVPDLDGVRLYLHNQFVPGTRTVVNGVSRLAPASYLSVDARGLHGPFRYWTAPLEQAAALPFQDWAQELRTELDAAVHSHLLSDVEVGLFLSGGLDSSIVLGLMAKHATSPVRAFSIGFGGHVDHDESAFARLAANRFGAILEHRDFSADDVLAIAPSMIGELEEPLGDPACLPTFLLAQLARRELKVVLSGEGADELFLGYEYYHRASEGRRRRGHWRELVTRLRYRRHTEIASWGEESSPISGFPRAMPARFVDALLRDASPEHDVGALQRELEAELVEGRDAESALARASLVDIGAWLPDDLLAKVDRMTMAHSLEARVPFLDHRVVELACRMPSNAKLRDGVGKAVLRTAFAELLGPELVTRRKHGFNLPMHRWLRGPLAPMLDSTLTDPARAGVAFLEPRPIAALLEAHRSGVGNFERALWSLHTLIAWFADAAQCIANQKGVDGAYSLGSGTCSCSR